MKAPIDPSEPLFPVRPNEPICQYYMKHGSCKFGQSCKFNHPPHPQLQAMAPNGRGQVVMNVGGRPAEAPHQVLLNPIGADASGSMMLQFLPQRPDEPDCIYFLKNGRCKYGATCRYHHPVNYVQQRRVDDSARRNLILNGQDRYRVPNVQYVGQLAYPSQTQVVATDSGPVTLVNLDGSSISQQGFQPLSLVTNNDGSTSYAIPINSIDHHGSTSSSIASSFETVSNLDRARRNGSGGSLNAYATLDSSTGGQGGRGVGAMPVLHSSASEGNIARRNRSPSYGSASEASYYADSATSTTASMSRNTSVGSWRNEHSSTTLDQARRGPAPSSQQYGNARSEGIQAVGSNASGGSSEYGQSPHSAMRSARVRTGSGGRPGRNSRRTGDGGGDEGFTMMTSALLNMLDTPPEEIGASFDEDDPRLMYAAYPPANGEDIDPAFFERLSINQPRTDQNSHAPSSSGHPPDEDEAVQVMSHHHHHHSSGPPSHDVGLYLP